MNLEWQWRSFAALSTTELYQILAARQAVFVVEQNCPYQDSDGYDQTADHLTAWSDGEVVAYLRVLGPGTKFAEPSIGRIITTKLGRGTGIGRELVARGIQKLQQLHPNTPIRIGAQAHLHKFYGSLGFVQASEEFLEDNIPHIEMVRQPGPVTF